MGNPLGNWSNDFEDLNCVEMWRCVAYIKSPPLPRWDLWGSRSLFGQQLEVGIIFGKFDWFAVCVWRFICWHDDVGQKNWTTAAGDERRVRRPERSERKSARGFRMRWFVFYSAKSSDGWWWKLKWKIRRLFVPGFGTRPEASPTGGTWWCLDILIRNNWSGAGCRGKGTSLATCCQATDLNGSTDETSPELVNSSSSGVGRTWKFKLNKSRLKISNVNVIWAVNPAGIV